jgi:hypothetical protein
MVHFTPTAVVRAIAAEMTGTVVLPVEKARALPKVAEATTRRTSGRPGWQPDGMSYVW